jgi:TatD DNase family protein
VRFVDSHSHIFANEFNHDRSLAIERAKFVGVKYIVLPNIDSSSVDALLKTTQEFPNFCLPTMGLHPTSVKENFEQELVIVEQNLAKTKFYGIGEIGIDLYWDKTHIEEQKIAFRYQIQLAKKLKLPVIIHSRNSFPEIFEIVDQENNADLKGVFHSFTGTLNDYNHILSYGGFMVGIGGVVTYKNGGVDKVVKSMNLEHILLETDSPYLSPVPKRGKRNESANIIHIAQKVSDILEINIEQIAEATTSTANSLFLPQ